MAGKFRKSGSWEGAEEESDSCQTEEPGPEEDDDMSNEEFADFKAWLERDQPDETPKSKRCRPPSSPEDAAPKKAFLYVEETSCPKCLKPQPDCSWSCV